MNNPNTNEPMRTKHHDRPRLTRRDLKNVRIIASIDYYAGVEPRAYHPQIDPETVLRADRIDPALLGVNPDLAGVR